MDGTHFKKQGAGGGTEGGRFLEKRQEVPLFYLVCGWIRSYAALMLSFFRPNAVLIGLTFNPMGIGLSCFSFS